MPESPPPVHDIADAMLTRLGEALYSSAGRRQMVVRAFGTQHPLLNSVDWEGAASEVMPRLVEAALDFGEHAPGQQALAVLLRSLSDEVGLEGQAELNQLADAVDAADWTVRPGSDRLDASPSAETSSLVLRLDRPAPDAAAPPLLFELQREFNAGYARVKLRVGLARFFQIGIERVKVVSVAEGSVIAVVELPAAQVPVLEAAFAAGDPRLAQLLHPFVLREIVPLGRRDEPPELEDDDEQGESGGGGNADGRRGEERSDDPSRGLGCARVLLGLLAMLAVAWVAFVAGLGSNVPCWIVPDQLPCAEPAIPTATTRPPPTVPPTNPPRPATVRPVDTVPPTTVPPPTKRPTVVRPTAIPTATRLPEPVLRGPDLVVAIAPSKEVIAIWPRVARSQNPSAYAVPLRGEIRNVGDEQAGEFALSVFYQTAEGGEPQLGYFRQSKTWHRRFEGLGPGEAISLDDLAQLPDDTRGQTVTLWVEVDSCAGEEFFDAQYCRVRESNERNNRSKGFSLIVRLGEPAN